ncbi:efflux RND transporter periplasmic adaptor subunit (plasmid) [Rhizobium lusitanum]|nr:efflux RND transporter periplasmic adaptor subunit [Rhizobium lusitanum]QND44385.1 efflux RND transporter periplasmic adaptor subunit [Rhizobium lusitanum]
MPHLQDLIRTTAAVMVCLALNSCDEKPSAREATQSQTVVATVKVQAETLPLVSELPGRIAPMMTADVRPRVTGMVLKRVFEQGSTVKQGDVLYLIDREPFEAKVQSAQATLDSAVAAQLLARQQAERQTQLQQKGVASSQDSESAVAKLAQSDADVARAHADLKTAQLDLQYTEVRAPISGAIGRALVTEGTLVSPTSDVLATIQRIDPVYADFTQPASTLITLKNAVVQGKLQADASGSAVLRLISEDGSQYPREGKLLFSEATVNSATGQVILRGEFPQSGSQSPAGYVCENPHRAGFAQGRARGSAAGGATRYRGPGAALCCRCCWQSPNTPGFTGLGAGWQMDRAQGSCARRRSDR